MSRRPTCRTVLVDGAPVLVRGTRDLTERDREALAEVVRAVTAQIEAEPVEVQQARQQRQQERRERVRRIRQSIDADPP